jgi:hypothetical protein
MALDCLRYEPDPADGLPRLRAPAGVLTAREHRALEAELASRHERLLQLAGRTVRLKTRPRVSPDGHFRVVVRQGHARLPTLILVPRPRSKPAAQPDSPWRQRLLEELGEVVCADGWLDHDPTPLDAFARAVEGLVRLAGESPHRLALVLLDLAPPAQEGGLDHQEHSLARQRLRELFAGVTGPRRRERRVRLPDRR